MTQQLNRRRVEMSELRILFVMGRLLAARAQQSGDPILKDLGHSFDNELDRMRDAVRQIPGTSGSTPAQIEENHHAG